MGKAYENANSKAVQWRKLLIAFSMIFVWDSRFHLLSKRFLLSGYSQWGRGRVCKEEEMVEEALILVEEDMMKKYGEKAYFNEEVEVDRVRGHKDDLASPRS